MHPIKTTDALLREGVINRNEPCTVLVARVLAREADTEDRHRPGTKWWEDMNIWDIDRPYSNIFAAGEVVHAATGRTPNAAKLVYPDGLTWQRVRGHLDSNKWYSIQGWRPNGTGHTVLLRTGNRPKESWILQSSVRKGLRINNTPFNPDHKPVLWDTWEYLKQYQVGLGVCELW